MDRRRCWSSRLGRCSWWLSPEHLRTGALCLGLAIAWCTTGQPLRAAARIELELLTESGLSVGTQQKWVRLLRELDVSGIRIRPGREGERIEVTNRGTPNAPNYHVMGVLTSRNALRLPGGRTFRYGDRTGMAAWLKNLRDYGIQGVMEKPAAFGLSARQLVRIHEGLAKPVAISTLSRPTNQVVETISRSLTFKVEFTPSARAAIGGNDLVRDELKGLASGTALAAAIRPLGLVMAPEKQPGNILRLRVTTSKDAKQSWPVGWESDKPPGQTAPSLFKFLNVQIDDVQLTKTLGEICDRVEIPYLVDHNALARHRVDLAQARVSLPAGRAFYKKILDRVLYQAKLKMEIRVDESGRPLLWITTLQQ